MAQLTMIGGGKMGEALLGGLISAGWAEPADLAVVEPDEGRRAEIAKRHEGLVTAASLADLDPSEVADALIAVKPDHVASVCDVLGSTLEAGGEPGRARVLSIAAGVSCAAMEGWLPAGVRVVRAMPNTPAQVGAGMAAISAGRAAETADLDWASSILAAVGEVVVLDETRLDAVTGVSGSGPAYVFLVAEAMMAAAVEVGLDPVTADVLTRQTLLGAARLLADSGEDPAQLRENVTSPGGTTAAGLAVLEDAGVRAAFSDAIAAATARSVELGTPDAAS